MKRHGIFRSPNMQISYNSSFKNVSRCKSLLNAGIGSISRGLVLNYAHTRMEQDGVSPATVNREIAFLKCMLSVAVESDVLENNPIQGLKSFHEAEKREAKLTSEQASELSADLPEPVANIAELALYTGFRKENILGLRIEQIRFHDITKTGEVELIIKGGRKEIFPLGLLAVEVLQRVIGDRKQGYVFIRSKAGARYKDIPKSFYYTVRKLDFTVNGTKLRFHDLRHVFSTWLHQAGVDVDTIGHLLGHSDTVATKKYISFNRLSYGESLKVIPKIERGLECKNSTSKIGSLYSSTGKNWQGEGQVYMTSLPKAAKTS